MKITFALAIIGATLSTYAQYNIFKNNNVTQKPKDVPTPIYDLFEHWMVEYKKTYANMTERNHRAEIFFENFKKTQADKFEGMTYELGMTRFSDLSAEEFKKKWLNDPKSVSFSHTYSIPLEKPRDKVDWRGMATTPVKLIDEGVDNWALAVAAAQEGSYAIKNDELIELSAQQLLDCTTIDNVWRYVLQTGIAPAKQYPWVGKKQNCQHLDFMSLKKITKYYNLVPGNQLALKNAVNITTVKVRFDASDFQLYKGGIYNKPICGDEMNYSSVVAGYGSHKDNLYWLLKMFWGEDFGEWGYIRVKREEERKRALCGITEDVWFADAVEE